MLSLTEGAGLVIKCGCSEEYYIFSEQFGSVNFITSSEFSGGIISVDFDILSVTLFGYNQTGSDALTETLMFPLLQTLMKRVGIKGISYFPRSE